MGWNGSARKKTIPILGKTLPQNNNNIVSYQSNINNTEERKGRKFLISVFSASQFFVITVNTKANEAVRAHAADSSFSNCKWLL